MRDNPQQRAAYECSVHRTDVLALLWASAGRPTAPIPRCAPPRCRCATAPRVAAALRATLRELEVAEELRICEAERSGHVIDRRPDVDVSIVFDAEVLGVEDAPAA